jgi:predicted kinase
MEKRDKLTLLVVAGVPGAGKTTAITKLLRYINFDYIDSDQIWKSIFESPKYTPEESNRVYEQLAKNVSLSLAKGKNTITEGVFASHERIIRLKRIANDFGANFYIVKFQCDVSTALDRMGSRYKNGGNGPVPINLWTDLHSRLKTWQAKEITLEIDTSTVTLEAAVSLILQLLSLK